MLNKLKVGILIAAIFTVVRVFLPDIAIPEKLQSAIVVIIVLASQFFVKESDVTISRLKLKKKKTWGSGVALIFLAFMLSTTPLKAQGYDKGRGREPAEKPQAAAKAEEDENLRFQFNTIAFGFGSFFDQESVTFSTDALYGAVQWHGVGLPVVKEGTSTGIMLEGHVGKIFGQEEFVYSMRVQGLMTVDYRIWSITRVPISAIPLAALQAGSVSRMYSGTDILLAEGGTGNYTDNFDVRLVFGGDLGVLGPGNMAFEIYSFQENLPIAFALFYGW